MTKLYEVIFDSKRFFETVRVSTEQEISQFRAVMEDICASGASTESNRFLAKALLPLLDEKDDLTLERVKRAYSREALSCDRSELPEGRHGDWSIWDISTSPYSEVERYKNFMSIAGQKDPVLIGRLQCEAMDQAIECEGHYLTDEKEAYMTIIEDLERGETDKVPSDDALLAYAVEHDDFGLWWEIAKKPFEALDQASRRKEEKRLLREASEGDPYYMKLGIDIHDGIEGKLSFMSQWPI